MRCAIGSAVTDPKTLWYRMLRKPEIQPPTVVFPIAWTALYASIAGASALAVTRGEEAARHEEVAGYWKALGVNLVLNTGWSALFWKGRNMKVAAVEAGLLAASSADLARRAGRLDTTAGALLVPYAAWCAFATVLSTRIEQVN